MGVGWVETVGGGGSMGRGKGEPENLDPSLQATLGRACPLI